MNTVLYPYNSYIMYNNTYDGDVLLHETQQRLRTPAKNITQPAASTKIVQAVNQVSLMYSPWLTKMYVYIHITAFIYIYTASLSCTNGFCLCANNRSSSMNKSNKICTTGRLIVRLFLFVPERRQRACPRGPTRRPRCPTRWSRIDPSCLSCSNEKRSYDLLGRCCRHRQTSWSPLTPHPTTKKTARQPFFANFLFSNSFLLIFLFCLLLFSLESMCLF